MRLIIDNLKYIRIVHITSRKNICLTLTKKYQLKFAYYLIKYECGIQLFKANDRNKVQSSYCSIISNKHAVEKHQFSCYSTIDFRGIDYRPISYISIFENDFKLFLILEVFVVENSFIFFLCQKIEKILYNSHFTAYEVEPDLLGEFQVISVDDIIGPPVHVIKTAKGKRMIRIKNYFKSV